MVPRISSRLWGGFARYGRWLVARHFHAVRLSRAGGRPSNVPPDGPLIVYMNHPSWWDPMIGILLASRWWPHRRHYAPIDAAALDQYRFFSRLGFFGVEQNSPRGAAAFLRNSLAILEQPDAVLWITPGGCFADPRARPVVLKRGLAHLVRRARAASVVPLAVEYPFWEERFPEALVRLGRVIPAQPGAGNAAAWRVLLQSELAATQDALAAEAVARRPEDFDTILPGRAGVGGMYDAWRRLRAAARGERFQYEHGAISR